MVQAWLASQGERVSTAAAVAELLQGKDVIDIVSEAKKSCRAISAENVFRPDFAESTPNPALGRLCIVARLGNVDAFVSHSWSDDAAAKWNALQTYRTDFKTNHGREPLLWIDKYCIDQKN